MRIAHLIMAYKEPAQIERLSQVLQHGEDDIYVHVDAKFPIDSFAYLASLPRVTLIKNRVSVNWGGYSLVAAMLASFEEIMARDIPYDYFNTLSGQDYPIKPIKNFSAFIEAKKGTNFFSYEPFGTEWWKVAAWRVERYHFNDFNFKGRFAIQGLINKLTTPRKFPLGYTLYGSNRSTWCTITNECARYLVYFFKKHRKVKRFARLTWAPDEFLFSTVVLNSPLKGSVEGENYRYFDWSQGGSNPKILTLADFDLFANSPHYFARKFDFKVDQAVLDKIDRELLSRETH